MTSKAGKTIPGKELTPIEAALVSAGRSYSRLATKDTDLVFAQEKLFLLGIIEASKPGGYSLKNATPESIGAALLQAGSLGLSFNPQLGHCYPIPRRQTKGDPNSPLIVYASPGYRGLIHLAVQAEAILWCVSQVVYEKDVFRYRGTQQEPLHEYDRSKPSGKPIGVYCFPKTPDGSYLVEYMTAEQIAAVRKCSDNPNGLMWTTFESEGWRKAVIRRAQKTWPRRNNKAMERFDQAVRTLNEHEGIILDGKAERVEEPAISEEQVLQLHAACTDNGVKDARVETWLQRLARRHAVAKIEHLPQAKFEEAKEFLIKCIKDAKAKKAAQPDEAKP